MAFTANVPNLRIYGESTRSYKFVDGRIDPTSEADAEEIRVFAKAHPQYAITEVDVEVAEDDLSSLTVAELRDLAQSRGLSSSGNKSELLERLQEE